MLRTFLPFIFVGVGSMAGGMSRYGLILITQNVSAFTLAVWNTDFEPGRLLGHTGDYPHDPLPAGDRRLSRIAHDYAGFYCNLAQKMSV